MLSLTVTSLRVVSPLSLSLTCLAGSVSSIPDAAENFDNLLGEVESDHIHTVHVDTVCLAKHIK